MPEAKILQRVVIEAPVGEGAIIQTGLEAIGVDMVAWHDWDEAHVRFEEYLDSIDEAEARVELLTPLLREWCRDGTCSIGVQPLENRDWGEAWREHFHAEQVSEHIIVRPPWETVEVPPDVHVIELNPGMSFGTGQHSTTRGCLRFIDEVVSVKPGQSFLDVGCGSGILTIAAARLGCARPLGVDCDPACIEVSRENARANGVGDITRFEQADAFAWQSTAAYDLVVANIYSNVLLRLREQLCASVARGGRMILSGILARHYEHVMKAYVDCGFRELTTCESGGWATALFRGEEG